VKTNLKKVLILAGLGLIQSISSAYAVELDLVGAVTQSMPKGTESPVGKTAYPGGGLILNFKLSRTVDFSLGGAYLARTFTTASEQTEYLINGQAGFRFNLVPALFVNAGGFANYSLNNPLGTTGTGYGVLGGVGIKIPVMNSIALLIHPQYQYSLSTLTYGSETISPHQVVGFVGFAISVN
jgi:hypothetical protein